MQEIVEIGTGTSLAVETAGAGETLLLIQGMSGHGGMWGPALVDELARDFEVVTYDHRGIGESARADDPFSIADLAADADGLLAALGRESAHVMGISMGGMVAQELVLRCPERIRTVTFGCTSPGGPGAFDAPGPGRVVEAISTRDPELATRVGFEVNVSAEFAARPGELDRFRATSLARRVPFPVVRQQSIACLEHDATDRLGDLRVPVAVVHGEEDQMILATEGERLAALVPGAELHLWPGVGHLFWWERPTETAAVVRELAARA
ncbi:MAG: alpha/beta hydrolase [Aeromicrobium sp.]|uniref:alpha/beta fold hydrolase n=1 Tax=Aeromicrobium sp. TaxID=1871063 RepID=UPI002612F50A|nr:alpha/beta hydrolase [Aeromicrobium sp.]MDF1706023.1 alpha/beta hydrolase [Aeromicrobium sp.]